VGCDDAVSVGMFRSCALPALASLQGKTTQSGAGENADVGRIPVGDKKGYIPRSPGRNLGSGAQRRGARLLLSPQGFACRAVVKCATCRLAHASLFILGS
jgi:hypothetical protein